jgi:hypothetical protein
MTNPVTATQTAATLQIASARTARATGSSFAQAHAAAVHATKDKEKASDAPKGERTQKVPGHNYVEIVSGPRNGMFINNSGNSRDGDAFLIVKRAGREFHVYGTGEDRSVYEVGRERKTAPATGTNGTGTTGTGTTGTGTTGTTGTGTTGTTPAGSGTATT